MPWVEKDPHFPHLQPGVFRVQPVIFQHYVIDCHCLNDMHLELTQDFFRVSNDTLNTNSWAWSMDHGVRKLVTHQCLRQKFVDTLFDELEPQNLSETSESMTAALS